jgi:hypothetical protein
VDPRPTLAAYLSERSLTGAGVSISEVAFHCYGLKALGRSRRMLIGGVLRRFGWMPFARPRADGRRERRYWPNRLVQHEALERAMSEPA